MSLRNSYARVRQVEGRLLGLAALFLVLSALVLTLSPAVRARSWQVSYPWMHWLGLLAWALIFNLAHERLSRWLPQRDPFLLPVAALLSGWGMLTIWRLLPSLGMRQGVWLWVSMSVVVLALRLPSSLEFLRRYKYLWLTGSLLLLAATLLFGTNPLGYGPRMWLGCCGLYLQPSEPLKLLFIAYLAAYMADREPHLALARARPRPALTLVPVLAPTLVVIGLALGLLAVQRDLGTASIFFLLYAAIVYVASANRRFLWSTALALLLAGLAGYLLFDVVRVRVDAWLNPWLDPSGRSYQVVQSLIALAAGGLPGRGLGIGNPSLVPVAHSDLIYAAIVEESGLAGALGLLALLALLAARGLAITLEASQPYHRYLAAGLTVYLVGQSLVIVGGSIRLLPLTGVTLPFVSYGGSSLLTSFLSLLILLHISHASRHAPPFARTAYPLGLVLLLGLAAAALATGWWAFYRSPALLVRSDNPRRAISDRSVRRGALLDRHGAPIQVSTGNPGEYTRLSLYPDLGSVAGYSNPLYGQSGLESGLDETLRGLQGNPFGLVWWHALLYGQPPPGRDVRLSLDLALQSVADGWLSGRRGAMALLEAHSGEILAMASHPAFDANRLEQDWAGLVADPDAPLLNRAAQGQYSPGAILGPLLYVRVIQAGALPPLPEDMDYSLDGYEYACVAVAASETRDWSAALAQGCPGAAAALGFSLGAEQLQAYYQSLGFYEAPRLRLPVAQPSPLSPAGDAADLALGQGLQLSPLQIALAAAAINAGGVRPAPITAIAVDVARMGWQPLAALDEPRPVLAPEAARRAAAGLAPEGREIWESVAVVPGAPSGAYTWYLGGAGPSGEGPDYVLALLLEEKNPQLARRIGRAVLAAALEP